MPRENKIWFWKDTGWWMVTLAGKKVRLAQGRENKKVAAQKFHELALVRAESPQSPTARVADLIESFLACNRPRLSVETMRNYDWYGQAFAVVWRQRDRPDRIGVGHTLATELVYCYVL